MSKIAFIFSGQGAQKIGMGKELYDNFDCAKKVFDEASDALGFDICDMIFNGDEANLQITENTQPCILTMSVAAAEVLMQKGVNPDVVAGLSLGEYSAHVCSGTFRFSDAVRLVKKRGRYMQEEVAEGVGAMAAIIGIPESDVYDCCRIASEVGICEPANLNCPGQIVVSGEKEAVEKCCEVAKKKGAKRAMLLAVSAPFHCKMLTGAGLKLSNELKATEIFDMNIPLISNVNADYIKKEDVRDILTRQVSSSVLWQKSVEKMIEDGIDTFIEVGPGKALSGFVKKISSDVRIFNVEDINSLNTCLEGLGIC